MKSKEQKTKKKEKGQGTVRQRKQSTTYPQRLAQSTDMIVC